jgi:hypothetical protein
VKEKERNELMHEINMRMEVKNYDKNDDESQRNVPG